METLQIFLAFVGALTPVYALLFWIGLRLGRISGKMEVLEKKCPLLKEEGT